MRYGFFLGIVSIALIYATAFSQPPGTHPGTSVFAGKNARIALLWGDSFQPAAIGIKAVSNLQETASANGLPVTGFDKVWIASGDLSKYAVLFMIADSQVQLTGAEKEKLADYIKSGGLLVLDDAIADKAKSPSGAALTQIAGDFAGSGGLMDIPNDHPVYNILYDLGGPPFLANFKAESDKPRMLRGVMKNGRLAVVNSDRGYSVQWSRRPNRDEFMDFGLNLIAYALVTQLSEKGR